MWTITEAILNQAGKTVYIDAEHAIFGFIDQDPNSPVNTMILFVKRFVYTCKFSGANPNANTLLKQIKEVCKIQTIKNRALNQDYPGWSKLEKYLNNVWPATVHEELGRFGTRSYPS